LVKDFRLLDVSSLLATTTSNLPTLGIKVCRGHLPHRLQLRIQQTEGVSTVEKGGHFTNACPKPHAYPNQTPAAQSTPGPNNSTPMSARQNYERGRINHVAIEDAQEAPDIVLDTFLVNSNTTIILFDSGASHSFIFVEYVAKYNLLVSLLECHMVVNSPSGDMPARQVCPRVNLKIRGVVILGMD
jgi:hypothetical protein